MASDPTTKPRRRRRAPLEANPIDAASDPTSQLRIALDLALEELSLAKAHGVPGAIVRLDVLEQLTRCAARELARGSDPSIISVPYTTTPTDEGSKPR